MNFIAKLMGIDLNRSYTDEELDAIRERWDNILRNMMTGTIVICTAALVIGFIYQNFIK